MLNKLLKKHRRKLIFFRHGETEWNRIGLIQGRTDLYLNITGIMQADQLGHSLKKHKIEHIICSPMKRAKTTGKIVADILGLQHNFSTHPSLIERNFGDLEGRKIPEVLKEYAEIFAIMDNSKNPENLHVTFPNAESKYDVLTRVIDYACNFMEDNADYNNVAVSCHGGILRYLNILINGKVTDYGNCDCIHINLNDLKKYKTQLKSMEKKND